MFESSWQRVAIHHRVREQENVAAPRLDVFVGHRDLRLKPQAINTPLLRSESQEAPTGAETWSDDALPLAEGSDEGHAGWFRNHSERPFHLRTGWALVSLRSCRT